MKKSGAHEESDPLKQMGLMPDYVNDSKYPVKLQINKTKLVLRDNLIFAHVKRLFMCLSLAQTLLGSYGGQDAIWAVLMEITISVNMDVATERQKVAVSGTSEKLQDKLVLRRLVGFPMESIQMDVAQGLIIFHTHTSGVTKLKMMDWVKVVFAELYGGWC